MPKCKINHENSDEAKICLNELLTSKDEKIFKKAAAYIRKLRKLENIGGYSRLCDAIMNIKG